MKHLRIFLCIVLAVLLVGSLTAQDFAGNDVATTALTVAQENCDDLERDQACYGHALVSAIPVSDDGPFNFVLEGDRVRLEQLKSLKLSGFDVEAGTWGVAMMALRANLASSQPQNITMLAFGDVQLENAVLPPTQAEVQVNTTEYVNVRLGPSTQVGVAGVLGPGQVVTALERLEDTSWLRVRLPEGDKTGWLLADLVEAQGDLQALNISDRHTPYYEPMQAFYFQSGENGPELNEVPESGLLIQTPEGVGEVQLLINEINVQLGSTVFFTARPGAAMTISTLEGHADVRAFGVEYTAFAGTQVSVPLDENMRAAGVPTSPQPYNVSEMHRLPVDNLARPVEVSPPRSRAEIESLMAAQRPANDNAPGQSGGDDCPGNSCNAPGQSVGGDDCPGQSCNAPGQGGSCPGNSCDAPGQSGGGGDDCPGNSCNAPGQSGGDEGDSSGGDEGDSGGGDDCPGQSCNAPGQGGSCPGNSCNNPGGS